MNEWLRARWERLRSSYWFIPAVLALSAVALSLVCARLDQFYRQEALQEQGWIYSGGPEGARGVLSTIAGSIITVAGTTFSITIAALSLASAQFGPRLLRNFMRDTGNQVVLGTFTATFLYCLLVLRTVRGLDHNTYVPHISVTVGVLLAVTSVGVLIYFIHHIAESIQVAHLTEIVAGDLHHTISRIFPEGIAAPAGTQEPDLKGGAMISAEGEGYVQAIDVETLLRATTAADVTVRLLSRPGDYVFRGMAVAIVWPDISADHAGDVRRAYTLGRERTPHQDVVFAFLQVAEIAVRALSPGINDPFTAITCVDRITAAMRQVADRSLPDSVRRDESGKIRVVARPYDYFDLVEAGYRHIRESAVNYWQVTRHLRARIESVAEYAKDPHYRKALHAELNAIDSSTREKSG